LRSGFKSNPEVFLAHLVANFLPVLTSYKNR
jgi:hypothetical protein